MAPLEGGVLVDFARLGGLAHRQRSIERPGKAEPALLLAQPCQRRAGQRIEGALAIKAAAARQAVPLPAPAFNAARAAVRAFAIVIEPLLQNTLHFVAIAALLQRCDHLLSLRVRQFGNQFIEPLQKLAMLHRAPYCRIRTPRISPDCGRNLRTTQTARSLMIAAKGRPGFILGAWGGQPFAFGCHSRTRSRREARIPAIPPRRAFLLPLGRPSPLRCGG